MRRGLALLLVSLAAGCGGGEPSEPSGVAGGVDADEAFTATMNRGVGLMGRFEFRRAREHFARAIELDPYSLDARLDLAIARLNQVDPDAQEEAIREFEWVLEREPSNLHANYCTGLAHLYLGRPAKAIPHLRLVAGADGDDPFVAYFLGQALEQDGRQQPALEAYERCLSLDPFLRSAWLGLQRIESRLDRADLAESARRRFEELVDNPRSRLAEFRYSRMGPLAMAVLPEAPAPPIEPGSVDGVFGPPVAFGGESDRPEGRPAALQPVDLDGDGDLDLVVPGWGAEGRCRVFLAEDGTHRADEDHPLARSTGVNCVLFGDVDADGRVDAYLCRDGADRLLLQGADASWSVSPVLSEEADVADSIDGALADLDHDGDLDVYVVRRDAHNRLLNNDGDGTFTDIAARAGVAGPATGTRAVLVADLDLDRDADLMLLVDGGPNQVLLNDRLWSYSRSDAFAAIEAQAIASIVAWYGTPTGRPALRVLTEDGRLLTWRSDDHGHWTEGDPVRLSSAPEATSRLSLADVTGDGRSELLVARPGGIQIHDVDDTRLSEIVLPEGAGLRTFTRFLDEPGRGPALLVLTDDRGLLRLPPGADRGRFSALRFSGRADEAQQMRSNASGIGTRWAARIGDTWQSGATWRSDSGPGQSLQPTAVGLGAATSIDFVSLYWPDGVYQSELAVPSGGPHLLAETQRQISSCPLVFVRGAADEPFHFLTDVLGVGGMGYLLEPGVAAPPRPVESLLLPGRPEELRLAEPMEEACYLDAVRLVAIDAPADVEVVVDERLGIEGPAPTSAVLAIEDPRLPVVARNERGEDVVEELREVDLLAADPGPLHPRLIGLLESEHRLEFGFDGPIDDCDLLLAEGWVEYPYSQTNFAAWQSGTTYDPPTLEALVPGGGWVVIAERFGYPAGMPRAMCLPIGDLPSGCTTLRLRSNQEIYWDRLRVARRSDLPLVRHVVDTEAAELAWCGFPQRTVGSQRQPHYDYQARAPLGDVRHQPGDYTAFGPCLPLVSSIDDASAIIGPGEELRVRFGDAPEVGAGRQRHWVLELNGWCKDMDLFTRDGERLEPLPSRDGRGPDAAARELMRRFNVRFAAGR